jgi:hypothetical protein
MGGWAYFCTSKYSHSQFMIRMFKKRREGCAEADTAQSLIDGLVFVLERGYIMKFLNYLIH